jgi:hypothetical protein
MPEAGIEPTCSTRLQRVYSPLPIHSTSPALLGIRTLKQCDKKKERASPRFALERPALPKIPVVITVLEFLGSGNSRSRRINHAD